MYTTTMGAPDPGTFMNQFTTAELTSKANKWQGRNITRWHHAEYDRLFKAAETELDPAKRAAHFIKMNDLVIQDVAVIPVLWRSVISAVSLKLKGTEVSGWDSNLWNLANWHREA
jgi:peptide/nickel transport system substrate-binding protein